MRSPSSADARDGANRDRGGRPKKLPARHAHAPSIYSWESRPGSGIGDQGSGIRDRGSGIRDSVMTLFEEFEWRGMVSEATEGVRETLANDRVTAYIGFDPTASSLH